MTAGLSRPKVTAPNQAPLRSGLCGAPKEGAAQEGVLVPMKTAEAAQAMSSPTSWDTKPIRNDTRTLIKPGRPTSGTSQGEGALNGEAYFGKMETKQSPLIGAIWGAVAWEWDWRGQGGKRSWEQVGEAALPTVVIRTRWGELLPAYREITAGPSAPPSGRPLLLSSSPTLALGSLGHSEPLLGAGESP